MNDFSYSFQERPNRGDIGSFSENFSKKGYEWENIRKQMSGYIPEKPQDPPRHEPQQNIINRENSWSFFNNPRSEWEEKRKNMVEDYRKEMQAKFQEKIEKDKKPRFIEKRELYNSMNHQERSIEDQRSYPIPNKSNMMNSSLESSPPIERFDYYSPQYKSKYYQNPPSSYTNPTNFYSNIPSNPSPSLYNKNQNSYSYTNPYQNSPQKKSLVEKSQEPTYEYSKTNMTSENC